MGTTKVGNPSQTWQNNFDPLMRCFFTHIKTRVSLKHISYSYFTEHYVRVHMTSSPRVEMERYDWAKEEMEYNVTTTLDKKQM